MEDKQIGMRWMTIYTILFAFQIISSFFASIYTVVLCSRYHLFTDIVGIISLLLVFADTIFLFFTFIHFVKQTKLGYTLNLVKICTELFFTGIENMFLRTSI